MKLLGGMKPVGDFVNVLRQVRTDEIAAEAARPFRIAVVGAAGSGKTTLVNRLAAGTFGGLLEPFGLRHMAEYSTPLSPAARQSAAESDVIIWLQDVTAPSAADAFGYLQARARGFLNTGNKADLLVGDWPEKRNGALLISALTGENVAERLVPAILDLQPELELSMGRAFSAFRHEVTEREILRVARVNAEVAIVSSIPQATLLLGPASALADTVILTKNQAMLLLRLAAMNGLAVDRGRLVEMVPVVGAAFGWRTLAREAVGFLPAGLGVVPKAVIAYAGTVAVGKAAAWHYQTGLRMPEAQFKQIYADSASRAKGLVREIAQRVKRAS